MNAGCCAINGYARDELLDRTIFAESHSNDADRDRAQFSRQVKGEIDSYSVEKRILTKSGRYIWVAIASSSVRDAQGRFRYGVRVMQDITERIEAEEKLRESEQGFKDLLAALPAAVYTTDTEGRITFYNRAAVDLWGVEPKLGSGEFSGAWKLYRPDGTPLAHAECSMAVAIKESRPIGGAEAIAERPDGTRVPFIAYPTPLRDAAGTLVGAVNMLVDISERKQAELRQKLMVDELNHRVKNTLATVQSLACQTARRAQTPDMFRERLEGRLMALSEAHDQLSRRNWDHADLREIADSALAPYAREAAGQVTVSGDPIRVNPRTALTFAMIFHELATNAAKYGALSRPQGRLALAWQILPQEAGPDLHMTWRESGGPEVAPPERRGFGTLLVERGVKVELGGSARLDFPRSGVVCEIQIPLMAAGETEAADAQTCEFL